MTECNNNTTVSELPTCDSVSRDSYIIVQNETGACKVKISDLVFSNDNVDFYGQIEQLLAKLNEVTSTVQSNSADWSITASTVSQNKPVWDTISEHDITSIYNTLTQGKDTWDNIATAVRVSSANWEATYQTVNAQKDNWQYAYDILYASQSNWDSAYTIAIDGIGAIHEAMALFNFEHPFDHMGLPGISDTEALEIKTAHDLYEDKWTSVYNTVKAFSGTW